ncbi:MAG: hypothetical protein HFI34_08595 [Lachnospiraceae bacterium]|nr:hypothetical protein [Lachnospiraceae bacterium]
MDDFKKVNILKLFDGEKYDYLLEDFGEKKITSRYAYLYDYLNSFISNNHIEDKVYISVSILEQVIVDYFVDVYRLKKFHHITNINENKIHAYTAYWLAVEKVLQIKQDCSDDKQMTAVNEWMVSSYLISYLFKEKGKSTVLNPKNKNMIEELKSNLLYSLRYRQVNPNMLETIIVAFKAGMSWQYSIDYEE